jgi:hypothetical protein
MASAAALDEKHFTVEELAERLNLSHDTTRRLFIDEPGVLVISKPFSKYRRSYRTIRVPESVVNRVYARLTTRAA